MSPTLPIANVAPPPARGGDARLAQGSAEATRNAAADGGEATRGDGDFAQALSHAQRPCKPNQEPTHAKAARTAGQPQARTAHGGRAAPTDPAPGADADARCATDADARCDASLPDAARAAVDGDVNTRPAQAGDELPPAPTVAGDVIALPCAAIAVHRDTLPAGEAPTVAAIEADGTTERAAPRGHERRARAGSDRNAAVPQAAPGGEAAATAQPLRATAERLAADANAVTPTAGPAPSFDAKAAPDAAPSTPWHAAAALRDASATVASSAESQRPHASVHAAIDDAAFAGALGRQVALWVRDGVQEARLHLHPAELGPVAVQIALDGQAARVDFTASVAATRDSIEQSLPALAAALREAGFTLSGGGVSSHAGGRSHQAPPEGGPAADDRPRAAGAADAAAGARRWTRSLLDVYA